MSYLSYPVQWQAIALSTLLTAYCFTMYEVLRSSIYVCAVVLWPQMKNQPGRGVFYLFIFNSIPFILFGLLFVSPSFTQVATQIGGHIARSWPPVRFRWLRPLHPHPHYRSFLAFLSRGDFSSFPRRLAWNCAYPPLIVSLSSWSFFWCAGCQRVNKKDTHNTYILLSIFYQV